jgi:hypothetical protein
MESIDTQQRKEPVPLERFYSQLAASVTNGTFRRLTLGKHRGSQPPERVVVTPAIIKGTPRLSFKLTYGTREETKNHDLESAITELRRLLGVSLKAATLFTTEADTTIQFSRKDVPSLSTARPSLTGSAQTSLNREKQYVIPPSAPFLHHLGITNAAGVVRGDKFDKFRQINKFVEVVETLVKAARLSEHQKIRVVDFGSGKNYLTFALHWYLSSSLSCAVETIGVEARQDLVEHGNNTAQAVGLDGLSFMRGDISATDTSNIDIVVALHACDTATDDALVKAIRGKARIIAVAPCCQKYIRPRMRLPADLWPIFHHGILEERFAESLTNGLRALVLEAFGYDAKVFEFIGGEHTAKNVMITATRAGGELQLSDKRWSEVARLRDLYQLSDFYLDKALGLSEGT